MIIKNGTNLSSNLVKGIILGCASCGDFQKTLELARAYFARHRMQLKFIEFVGKAPHLELIPFEGTDSPNDMKLIDIELENLNQETLK